MVFPSYPRLRRAKYTPIARQVRAGLDESACFGVESWVSLDRLSSLANYQTYRAVFKSRIRSTRVLAMDFCNDGIRRVTERVPDPTLEK